MRELSGFAVLAQVDPGYRRTWLADPAGVEDAELLWSSPAVPVPQGPLPAAAPLPFRGPGWPGRVLAVAHLCAAGWLEVRPWAMPATVSLVGWVHDVPGQPLTLTVLNQAAAARAAGVQQVQLQDLLALTRLMSVGKTSRPSTGRERLYQAVQIAALRSRLGAAAW